MSKTLNLPAERLPTFNGSTSTDSKMSGDPIPGSRGGKVKWIGNATCIIEYKNIRFMTDPNFLHQGDHVHLGPGVTGTRLKDPAFPYTECPPVDFILLSHLHEDHYDKLVAEKLNRSIPIISTLHATEKLSEAGHLELYPLETWEKLEIKKDGKIISITSMPGKHTLGLFDKANDLLNAIPPVMGSLITFDNFTMYISGDTLYYDELKEIHRRYPQINLALIHLGGTTLPIIHVMVTMDAEQGIKLLCALQPEKVIPIHFDDYDVFKSPLKDFKEAAEKSGWGDKIVYLNRGEESTSGEAKKNSKTGDDR